MSQTKGQPEWFQRLRGAVSQSGFHELGLGGPVRVFVPARVRLKLQMQTSQNSSWVAESDEQVLDLAPGETKDLGELKLVPVNKEQLSNPAGEF